MESVPSFYVSHILAIIVWMTFCVPYLCEIIVGDREAKFGIDELNNEIQFRCFMRIFWGALLRRIRRSQLRSLVHTCFSLHANY